MITTTDIAPFAGTVGGGFFLGFIAGYAIKKVMRLAVVIIGLLIAALAYLEYQRILSVDWTRIQAVLQNGIIWLTERQCTCEDHAFKFWNSKCFGC